MAEIIVCKDSPFPFSTTMKFSCLHPAHWLKVNAIDKVLRAIFSNKMVGALEDALCICWFWPTTTINIEQFSSECWNSFSFWFFCFCFFGFTVWFVFKTCATFSANREEKPKPDKPVLLSSSHPFSRVCKVIGGGQMYCFKILLVPCYVYICYDSAG